VIVSSLQPFAQILIERVVNSLPAGLLIAAVAWALLCILPNQNSRTRFAVWFVALLAVASVPIFGGFAPRPTVPTLLSHAAAAITLPASWAIFVSIAWALTALVMTARLLVGLWRLRELRQTCNPVELAELDPSLRDLFAELNSTGTLLSRPVTLATSDLLRVPAAIGLWKPMIVFPSWALRELSPSDLDIILRHEFAHLRHWDDWTNLIQKCVRAVFFFHPAVWWIEKRLSLEREMACDDVVIAQSANPAGYASCLVSLLERSLAERGWTMAQAMVHRAREASTRLARILDTNRLVATRISKPALGLVGTLTALCLIAAPNTPQVISFEQRSSQSMPTNQNMPTAEHEYSAALSAPTIQPLVQHTDLRSSTPRAAATQAVFNPASKAASMPKIRKPVSTDPTPMDPAAMAAANEQPAPSETVREDIFIASAPASLPVSEFPNEHPQSLRPAVGALVFVQETQFVETDSSVVWRIQVWRVTFVHPKWEHTAPAPAAHST